MSADVSRLRRGSFLDLTLGQVLVLLVFNCLLFEDPIQSVIGFKWIDELSALLLFICGCAYSAKKRRSIGFVSVIVAIIGVVFVTALGTALAAVGQPAVAVLIDMYAYIKFPLAFLGALMIAPSLGRLRPFLLAEAKLLSVVLCFCGLANLFVDFGMRSPGGRYWSNSFQGVWSVPTLLVASCVGLIAILSSEDIRKNRAYIVCCCLAIILSQRSKGFAAVGILVILLTVVGKKTPRLNAIGFLVIATGAVVIGWDAFVLYFGTTGFARSELLRNGFNLAVANFPLGTGFATYGSASSGDYYSPLYGQLGLDQVYGLSLIDHGFLSDTFWPTVAGQSGFLGLFLYLAFLLLVYRKLSKLADSKDVYISLLFPFFYLLISSSSEAAFFAPSAVYLALAIGIGAAGARNRILPGHHQLGDK